ncbi:MAG TPA: Gfo/Idh/MocA family oxidoreductase [Geminicoccus sp.]|jgi:predicted dehydrogenase|uniref:Gfo/Idh/MocA family protein n=1 Tax=Geminicoccus sp. TaxID=2024832 RepID=UPI002E324610|nr:Gfo/Idh/MocA family oxidoreductase [Geminicoccus sp.]HEX2528062.1 Gfo/Idh/MocA family oxidoreductase [Geminicoccus sp.]
MLRAAVVGAGHFGRWHVQKWATLPGAELVGVADRNAANDRGDAPFTTDWRSLLGRVDAVSVATPTQVHAEIATAFLDAGAHVFVEKPITADVPSAQALVEHAERLGLVLQVGHVERFNPAWVAGRSEIRSPRRIEMLRVAPFQPRSLDVSVILDLMIHDLDLLLDVVPAPVESLEVTGQSVLSPKLDRVDARLRFADGTVADVTSSRIAQATMRRATFAEPGGRSVEIDFQNRVVAVTTPGDARMDVASQTFGAVDTVRAEIEAFCATIRGECACAMPGRAGLAALELALRIEAAARLL